MSPSTCNFGPKWPTPFKNGNFRSIFASTASAVKPSKKVQLALIGSTTWFPMSLRWTSYAASSKPPKRRVKTQSGRFSNKTSQREEFCNAWKALKSNKKVCYKFPLCKNCQRQSCKAFTGLFKRAQMLGGVAPFHTAFARSLCDS